MKSSWILKTVPKEAPHRERTGFCGGGKAMGGWGVVGERCEGAAG